MDNQPTFDRSIFIPIVLSGFSVIGIIAVLLIGRMLNSPAEVAVTPSATRFQYVYLGTEPAVNTPVVEPSEVFPTDEPIEEPGVIDTPVAVTSTLPVVLATPTRPGAGTPIVLTLPNATNTFPPTLTSASGPPLNPGTYDDVYPNLLYLPQQNGWRATGTGGSTLHVSDAPGSTLTFRFVGRELRLIYQGGITLGQLRITIDNVSETLDQSSGNEWVSDQFPNGTHSVLITHTGGGSVNIDQVIIPEPANTPTRTPTSTQNS